jgi:hypothetical protein
VGNLRCEVILAALQGENSKPNHELTVITVTLFSAFNNEWVIKEKRDQERFLPFL